MVETVAKKLRAIDYDAPGGVIIKTTEANVDVYMYMADPGHYYSVHGNAVSEELAKQAGYDVVLYGNKRKIKEAAEELRAKMEAELAAMEVTKRVVAEKLGFQVIELTKDRCQVISPDGQIMNEGAPITEAEALKLLENIAS
jgi:hypothetical protein